MIVGIQDTTPNAGGDVEPQERVHCWWGRQRCSHFAGQLGGFSQNTFAPYSPAVVLPGVYPKELKAYVHAKTWTWMFVAALFTVANTQKQLDVLQEVMDKQHCGPSMQGNVIRL